MINERNLNKESRIYVLPAFSFNYMRCQLSYFNVRKSQRRSRSHRSGFRRERYHSAPAPGAWIDDSPEADDEFGGADFFGGTGLSN